MSAVNLQDHNLQDPKEEYLATESAIEAIEASPESGDFYSLFYAGEHLPGEDASKRDFALFQILARQIGDNPALIEAVAQLAARARPKWNEKRRNATLLQHGIRSAIAKLRHKGTLGKGWPASSAPEVVAVARCHSLATILQDPKALEPPPTVAPNLGWLGRVAILAGREKYAGKSTLLTAAAAAVTKGTRFLGAATQSGPVLWVTADQEHAHDIAARAVRFGADPERFHVLWPGAAPRDEYLREIDRVKPVWLIIDSLANYARGYIADAHKSDGWPDVLLPLKTDAAARAMAVTLAHHMTKATGEYRDSTAIGANVDMMLLMGADDDHPTWRRISGVGRWTTDAFTVDLVGDAYRLVIAAEVAAASERGQDRQAVLQALADLGSGPHKTAAIALKLGWDKRRVDRHLKPLAGRDVTRRKHGQAWTYRLTAPRHHTTTPHLGGGVGGVVDAKTEPPSHGAVVSGGAVEPQDDLPF
jgi:hypothetical protein